MENVIGYVLDLRKALFNPMMLLGHNPMKDAEKGGPFLELIEAAKTVPKVFVKLDTLADGNTHWLVETEPHCQRYVDHTCGSVGIGHDVCDHLSPLMSFGLDGEMLAIGAFMHRRYPNNPGPDGHFFERGFEGVWHEIYHSRLEHGSRPTDFQMRDITPLVEDIKTNHLETYMAWQNWYLDNAECRERPGDNLVRFVQDRVMVGWCASRKLYGSQRVASLASENVEIKFSQGRTDGRLAEATRLEVFLGSGTSALVWKNALGQTVHEDLAQWDYYRWGS